MGRFFGSEPYYLRVGRLGLLWRPGSWCRPGEWVFARQPCDEGCLVLDCGFFVVEWLTGNCARWRE